MRTYPTVEIALWTEDAIVLMDWLETVDFDEVPSEHKAVKQALTDLASRLEEVVPYELPMTPERVATSQEAVSRGMGR
ncbi:hypothetical protein SOM10_05370 [Microbacterium sp. CFBP9023]|uniref:hypothetical protein n=1 Tax=Microbacterium sp. CFBP9023 TaxID=3096535 RepID=UPI002A6ADA91|nr:hypothetical protein [Microbacterium sp. CFBP9023]MDY0983313.1 hypothetical protein [Microbacterium sp. CFBP9023]